MSSAGSFRLLVFNTYVRDSNMYVFLENLAEKVFPIENAWEAYYSGLRIQ